MDLSALKVVIGGDWSKAQAAFDGVGKKQSEFVSKGSSSASAVTAAFTKLGTTLTQFAGSSAIATAVLSQMGGVTSGAVVSAFSEMGNKLGQVSAGIDTVIVGLNALADTAGQMGAILTASLSLPIAELIKLALGFDDLRARATIAFTTMLGSTQAATAMVQQLQQFAVATPFDFPELLTAAQRLGAMGVKAKEIIPDLRAVGDAVAVMGGTQEIIQRVTLALGQMLSKGRVQGDEMLQLTEANVHAWDILAKAAGKTTTEMQKLVSKGVIPADWAVRALVAGMEKNAPDAMTKMSGTMMTAFSNLKDAAVQSLGDIFKPFYDSATKVLGGLSIQLMNLRSIISTWSDAAKLKIAAVLIALAAIGPAFLAIAATAKAVTLLASPWGALALAIGAATYYLLTHKQAAIDLGNYIESHLVNILDGLKLAFVAVAAVGIVKLVTSIGAVLLPALRAVGVAVLEYVVAPLSVAMFGAAATMLEAVAAMVATIGILLIGLADIASRIALVYAVWKQNWLGFQTVVDGTIRFIEGRVEDLLSMISMIPGSIGDASQKALMQLQVLGAATSNFSSKGLMDLAGGIGQSVFSEKNFMQSFGLDGMDADLQKLMKQMSSYKATAFKMPAIPAAGPLNMLPGTGKEKKSAAEKAAEQLKKTYADMVTSIQRDTAKLQPAFYFGQKFEEGSKQADVAFELTKGSLSKLASTFGIEALKMTADLLNVARAFDMTKVIHDANDSIKKLYESNALNALPQKLREVVGAVGSKEWANLGKIGEKLADGLSSYQEKALGLFTTGLSIEAFNQVTGAMQQLAFETAHAGQETYLASVQAAGGADRWKLLTSAMQEQTMQAIAMKSATDGVVSLYADMSNQVATFSATAQTEAQKMGDAIDALVNKSGVQMTAALQAMIDKALTMASALDGLLANKQVTDWGTQFDSQIDALKAKIAGLYDPAIAAVNDWKLQNKDALDKLAAAGVSVTGILAKVGDAFKLDRQLGGVNTMRQMMGDLQKLFLALTELDPFKAFKNSLMQLDENGKLKLPDGMDEASLKKIFDLQQKMALVVEAANGIRDVLTQAFDDAYQKGFKTFFTSVIAGFQQMLYKMAANYLTSQLVQLLSKGLANAFGIGDIIGAAAGAGTGTPTSFQGYGGAGVTPMARASMLVPSISGAGGGGITAGDMSRIMSSSSAVSKTVVIAPQLHVHTPDAAGMKASQSQIMADLARATAAAARRNH